MSIIAPIPIQSDAHWHELRRSHIGSSEVASLFDASPYLTRFELWHRKKGNIVDTIPDTERMEWGRRLEAAIGQAAAANLGIILEKATGYYQHPMVAGMGATPDFMAPDIIVACKNVDGLQYARSWENGEPPMHYLLQLQHQLACTGFRHGYIAVLIGGNEFKIFPYERHEGAIAKIEHATTAFWQSIAENREPAAVAEDYDVIRQMMNRMEDTEIDLAGDNEFPDLCARAKAASARKSEAEKEEKACKAAIIQKMNNHARARCGGFTVKATTVSKKEYTVSATSYQQLTIKEEKAA